MAETYWINDDYRFADSRSGDGRIDRDSADIVGVVATGALAGLLGTVVVSLGMAYGPRIMEKYGLMDGPSAEAENSQSTPPASEAPPEPTELLVDKVSGTAFDTELPPGPKHVAGQAVHWGYGAAWGAAYSLTQRQLQLPSALAGLALGAVVGSVASTVVPALGLTPPPTEQLTPQIAMMSGLHLLYGETVALTFDALSRG